MDTAKLLTIKSMSKHALALKEVLKNRADAPKLNITSLPKLNLKLWGLKERTMVLIGARTSMGKSSFAAQITLDIADQNYPIWFVSLEMCEEDIIERMFCNKMTVDNIKLLHGDFKRSVDYQNRYESFLEMTKSWHLIITAGIGYTFSEIIDVYERFKEEEKPKLLVIDYIQAIKTTARQSLDDLNEYIRHLREFAVLNNMCVILVSQINRDAKNNLPENYQLKGSGVLEEHADVCMLLHWPYMTGTFTTKSEYKLRVTKNRNGRTGIFDLFYYPQYYQFAEAFDENKENELA